MSASRTPGAQPWLDSLEHPYLIAGVNDQILSLNAQARAYLSHSCAEGDPFSAHFEEPATLQVALQQCHERGQAITLRARRAASASPTTQRISIDLIPLPRAENPSTPAVLVSLRPERESLERLEETARHTDARIQNLSKQLSLVSNELLLKTAQLAEQRNKTQTIINGMTEGLLGCDESGRVIQHNQQARRILKCNQQQLDNQPLAEAAPVLGPMIQGLLHSPQPGRESNAEVRIGELDIRATCTPIHDQDGQLVGFVLILDDLTRQREVDRMKADIISIVSHEMRSPLTSIKGYVDLICNDPTEALSDNTQEYLKVVSANANRLSALVDDMLDLARIESGSLPMAFSQVDIQYLCESVVLNFKPAAQQKEQRFTRSIEGGVFVSGDLARLQQAVSNLVSNAVKYTPDGGEIALHAFTQNHEVLIEVRDSGVGIAPEHQTRIFSKFFRVKDKSTRQIGGTGLGLAIVQTIVEAHEGTIEVESEPDVGSLFRIRLPQYERDHAPDG